MASRLKEEEKNERIIRGLLKLPENRRCINCASLGPQYVCTNFRTFVCTTCSGIHREFTHRIKSVSMAKFTSQEVSALQEGGNQRAKEIYLKEWDTQRNSFPDISNVGRLRDFIKHVYVDRRYTGERNHDKPSRAKMGDREDFNENVKTDGYQSGPRSPPYEDTYERRYGERSSPGARSDERNSRYGYDERRSPGYDHESRQYGDYRSPARPEVVNDWRREDRFSNGRKLEDRRKSDGDPKLEGRSPERPKDHESSSPPVVRPIREILGENVLPLCIQEPPKADDGRTADGSPQAQRTASSSSLVTATTNGNAEVKLETTVSLIDFDADPEPTLAATVTTQQTTMTQSVVQPTSSANDNNWASFDNAPAAQMSQAPSNTNTLDSVLSQLSAPASLPNHTPGASSSFGVPVATSLANTLSPLGDDLINASITHPPTIPLGAGAPTAAPLMGLSTFPPKVAVAATPGMMPVSSGSSSFNINNAGQWPSMQHQQPSLVSAAPSPSPQQFMQPVHGAPVTQPWNFSLSQKTQGPLSTPAAQASQAVSKTSQGATSNGALQPSLVETKSTGRKELPEDLFTATYPTFLAPVPGWHPGLPLGMGFPMQYNIAAPMPTFQQSSRSINPFDIHNEAPAVQTQTFPSMGSLQGALPNMPSTSVLLHTSSLGTPSPTWMPPPQSLPSSLAEPSQAQPYGSALPPRTYTGPQVPSSMKTPSHQVSGIGSETGFGFVNMDQQFAGRFSAPATPQPFSSVNPFG
ncbi:hypothetical protein SLEP1_g13415 [Rubroshorea leprosula]|uniref:Arf-GAP domain-containing protein n=1 Tax=Rubroshorea leprosula TaxID=152421 RepID=A0AAV5IFT2_9ROSI|nr:hypothetical protein SLEP1_g13415 [Rubroshorea leprosula]